MIEDLTNNISIEEKSTPYLILNNQIGGYLWLSIA